MNGISPWAIKANTAFAENDEPETFNLQLDGFTFKGRLTSDSFWIYVSWANGGNLGFRPVYAADGALKITDSKVIENGYEFDFKSLSGNYNVQIKIVQGEKPAMHYTTTLTPASNLLIPFWPRDIIALGEDGKPDNTAGHIVVSQVGTRSGQLYFTMDDPRAGAAFYLQNLTALNDYCEQTETSAGGVVGGGWPEMGFALPHTVKDKALQAGKNVIISDAFVVFDSEYPVDEAATVRQFLSLLEILYLLLPKPETTYKKWPEILDKGLDDLIDSPGCWSQVGGNHYFNAYVCDYITPPEIMVQLAVLLPLLDYVEWTDAELRVMKQIKEGLPAFYDEKLGTIVRWHPKAADRLEGEEEQKEPATMDSWYLHHPLLNLSRLALKGDEVAKKLFLDSLDFSIKVAHHFDYQWPVFYKIDTLEVIKAETQPGKGGEKDVPGLYAHVMLQAWELTQEERYLEEAEKAAQRLQGLGFDLFYQANNTAFSSGALLRLYKITKNELYKELSYLCLANIFKNVRLWDCNYGYGKNFPSFFTVFPLNDAPYSAAYEEQEVFCAFHDYLRHAQGEDIFPPIRLLISEYIRYLVHRAVYYYPPMLPAEMLVEKPKVGELDPNLWVVLEDLQDGWEASGQVGQEVYGAGNAFGILPRHYMQVEEHEFMVFVDYPTIDFSAKKSKPVTFQLAGDGRMTSRMVLVNSEDKELPEFTVTVEEQQEPLQGKQIKDGHIEYFVKGDQKVKIDW